MQHKLCHSVWKVVGRCHKMTEDVKRWVSECPVYTDNMGHNNLFSYEHTRHHIKMQFHFFLIKWVLLSYPCPPSPPQHTDWELSGRWRCRHLNWKFKIEIVRQKILEPRKEAHEMNDVLECEAVPVLTKSKSKREDLKV